MRGAIIERTKFMHPPVFKRVSSAGTGIGKQAGCWTSLVSRQQSIPERSPRRKIGTWDRSWSMNCPNCMTKWEYRRSGAFTSGTKLLEIALGLGSGRPSFLTRGAHMPACICGRKLVTGFART